MMAFADMMKKQIVMPAHMMDDGQGLTLVPISAQLELFCPSCNPTQLMNVSWTCAQVEL